MAPGTDRALNGWKCAVESNQAMGLRSPVLLDQQGMSVGRLFGATSTPMAVLVDGEGKIASELAAGAPAVLALGCCSSSTPNCCSNTCTNVQPAAHPLDQPMVQRCTSKADTSAMCAING